MPLTDAQVRTARYNPDGAGNRLSDGGRMYLQPDKSGAKYWRMNFRFAGKDKTLALGVYPDVSLAAARKKRDEVRAKLTAGMDPSVAKKADRRAARFAAGNTFKAVALAWMEERKSYVEPRQHENTLARPNEQHWIEHQLAHAVPDSLGSAYNRTKFIRERAMAFDRCFSSASIIAGKWR